MVAVDTVAVDTVVVDTVAVDTEVMEPLMEVAMDTEVVLVDTHMEDIRSMVIMVRMIYFLQQ